MEMTISAQAEEMEDLVLEISRGGTRIRVSLEKGPDLRFAMMPPGMKTGFSAIPCVRNGPNIPENEDIARMHDALSLTNREERAVMAISGATSPAVTQMGCIGDRRRRRPLVRTEGREGRRTLRSLGTAALQATAIALGLENARGGLLLLDEADGSMSHEAKAGLWEAAITRAVLEDTQIFAVTNRTSTIRALAHAAGNFPGDNIARVRINGDGSALTDDLDALGREMRAGAEA